MKTKFTDLMGQLISTPVITCESPMDLTFTTQVHGDALITHFMGSDARALKGMLRKGDFIRMNGFVDKGVLVIGHVTMDTTAAVGRQVNYFA